MSREKSVLDERTQIRFNCEVKLSLAIERYMKRKGVSKGKAIEEFLIGSKTLQEEVKKVEELYRY